jgi:hypothetical protein
MSPSPSLSCLWLVTTLTSCLPPRAVWHIVGRRWPSVAAAAAVKHHRVDWVSPPHHHQCLLVIPSLHHLAQRLTLAMLTPPTKQHGSRREALDGCATAGLLGTVTARSHTLSCRSAWATQAGPTQCGRGPIWAQSWSWVYRFSEIGYPLNIPEICLKF